MYEIVIEYGAFNQIKITITKDGARVSPFTGNLPSPLRQLGRHSGSYQSIEDELVRALLNLTVPVQLRVLKPLPLVATWDPTAFYRLQWELSVEAGAVSLRQGAIDSTGDACIVSPIGKQLVVDLKRNLVGRVVPSEPGTAIDLDAAFRRIKAAHTKVSQSSAGLSDHFQHVKTDTYNLAPIVFENESMLHALRFSDANGSVQAKPSFPEYRINLAPDPADPSRFLIQTAQFFSGNLVLLTEGASPIFECLVDLPGAIGSVTWRRGIAEVVRRVLEVPDTDIDSITRWIYEVVPNALPPQYQAAIDLLQQWLGMMDLSEVVAYAGESWWFSQHNWVAQSAMVAAITLATEGAVIEGGVASVSSEVVYSIAEQLIRVAGPHGVQVNWNQIPLRFESWEIEANVVSDGDRYVVDPVIRFEGRQIRLESWDSILSANGLQLSDSAVTMLSSETIEAIRALLRYKPDADKSKASGIAPIILGGRLRILDVLYLIRAGVRVNLSEEDRVLIEALQQFKSIPRVPLPSGFLGDLREYQRVGFDWLVFLYKHRFGACLADDMGLGKTIQAIAFVGWISQQTDRKYPSLIVVPPSLVYNWRQELKRFAPCVTVSEYTGTGRVLELDGIDVVVSTYDIVRRDIDRLCEVPFGVIVFDEAQVIKNMAASRSTAVRRLKGDFKVCLTGTPLENHTGEFVSILELAVPGLTEGLSDGRASGSTIELVGRARPFVLRRTKEKILQELPEKIESTVYLPLSEQQQGYYKRVVTEVRAQIKQMFERYKSGQAGLLAITALLRLRQLCITPGLIDPNFDGSSPKIDFLVEKLIELQEEGHSALVFTQFRSFANILGPLLEEKGVNLIQIDGHTRISDRKKMIELFQQSDQPMVALMTLKTGGVGLNLVKASYVFHADPWWNPAAENQASDRAHRIGQTQKVNVIRLIMQGSIEEKVQLLKGEKQQLFDEVVNQGLARDKRGTLSRDDFNFLLS